MEWLSIHIRFWGGLNRFIETRRRYRRFRHRLKGRPSIKDTVEALGVPHTEIARLTVSGRPVSFDFQLRDGADINVYPPDHPLIVPGGPRLQPTAPRPARFICDVHLGKLVRRLRLLGFDCLYQRDYEDDKIIALAAAQRRIILTRDTGLLKHGRVRHGYFVRRTESLAQTREVLRRYALSEQCRPFRRCLECNGLIRRAAKKPLLPRLPPKAIKFYDTFYQCRNCGQVYWKGSHYADLLREIKKMRGVRSRK